MCFRKKEIKGNKNQTIQGNNNNNNNFLVQHIENYHEKKDLNLNIEDDLKDLILEFNKNKSNVSENTDSIKQDFACIKIEEKNKLNNLSEEYFLESVRVGYPYFDDIDNFLSDNRNEEYKEMFYEIVEELRIKFINHSKKFEHFEYFLEYVKDKLLDKYNLILRGKKKFILIFLHYMYCKCFIGRKI